VTIRATIQTDGPFISLAFEVADRPGGLEAEASPPRSFGPLRLATMDDAVVLLSQFARYVDEPKAPVPSEQP